jgi:hypothetical protein
MWWDPLFTIRGPLSIFCFIFLLCRISLSLGLGRAHFCKFDFYLPLHIMNWLIKKNSSSMFILDFPRSTNLDSWEWKPSWRTWRRSAMKIFLRKLDIPAIFCMKSSLDGVCMQSSLGDCSLKTQTLGLMLPKLFIEGKWYPAWRKKWITMNKRPSPWGHYQIDFFKDSNWDAWASKAPR